MFEYLIILYSKGTVTTVIGFADQAGAKQAFDQSCMQNNADWAYLYKGDGQVLASFGL